MSADPIEGLTYRAERAEAERDSLREAFEEIASKQFVPLWIMDIARAALARSTEGETTDG